MRTDKYEKKYKEYIQKVKRLDEIRNLIMKAPLVELKEPYQRGWEIYVDLREDIKRRKDADLIRQVLRFITHPKYTRDPNLVSAIRKSKSYPEKFVDVNYNPLPSLQPISEITYQKLPDNLKRVFYLTLEYNRFTKSYIKRYYTTYPSYFFVLRTRKNIITHRKDINPDLESERDELYRWLYDSGRYFKGHSRTWRRDKYYEEREYKKRFGTIEDDIKEFTDFMNE